MKITAEDELILHTLLREQEATPEIVTDSDFEEVEHYPVEVAANDDSLSDQFVYVSRPESRYKYLFDSVKQHVEFPSNVRLGEWKTPIVKVPNAIIGVEIDGFDVNVVNAFTEVQMEPQCLPLHFTTPIWYDVDVFAYFTDRISHDVQAYAANYDHVLFSWGKCHIDEGFERPEVTITVGWMIGGYNDKQQ